ncbi:MAG: hypothetical protein HKO90_11055 [Flavobacteriaceae bacterium]|nr:hypothetical protein [Flavobacteriaceae bacterium]
MTFKKLVWALKRHPFLYRTRFKLLSRYSTEAKIEEKCYNTLNKKKDLPELFHQTNLLIFPDGRPDSDWDTVCAITSWMIRNIKGGSGLSISSAEALVKMMNGEGGVCSDKVQVFNNFCVVNDLKVREWGSTRIPFNKNFGGHSFNEVYCKELNKWVFIDVSYGLYFSLENQLLSVLELSSNIKAGNTVELMFVDDSLHIKERIINRIYYHEDTTPFLICNYSNRLYDWFLKRLTPILPVFVIHFLIFLIGRSYYYLFLTQEYD